MNWYEGLARTAVAAIRKIEPTFLTEETSLAWQDKDARAAAALQKNR